MKFADLSTIVRGQKYGPVRLASLERCRNSAEGNPRWWIGFTNGARLATAPDTQLGNMIDNPEFRDVDLVFWLDGAGRARRVAIVMSEDEHREFKELDLLAKSQMLPESLVPVWRVLAARWEHRL